MRRALLWLFGCTALWGALAYLDSRPRFWAWLALTSEHISIKAREAYNITKTAEIARWARLEHTVKQSIEPLPDYDNVIDAVRYFLTHHQEHPIA